MKLTYILLIALIILTYGIANAEEGLYIEAGLSVHSTNYDAPEVMLESTLGNIGFGYTFKYESNSQLDIYFKHTSGIKTTEDGYGLNQIGLQYRKYL